MIKDLLRSSYEYHTSTNTSIFKLFVATVLVQFSLLSVMSVSAGFSDIPILESVFASSHMWWGFLGMFGAFSLLFENFIKKDKFALSIGYISAIMSFILLSYDFVARKPPIHTGGILSVTAGIFLGGLLYGHHKRA